MSETLDEASSKNPQLANFPSAAESSGGQWRTFGHDQVKKILDQQLASGRFPHAYLFFGPEGAGKKTLAWELAGKILRTETLNAHPDFFSLETEGEIVMEEARRFLKTLSFKPFFGSHKVAVINNAQNLNLQSSNALLKSLEEPSLSNVIILVASGRLLPTIVSRCQKLNFNAFSFSQLRQFAQNRNIPISENDLPLAFGSPGRLLRFFEEPDRLRREEAVLKRLQDWQRSTLGQRLLNINALAGLETAELKQILLTWAYGLKAQFAARPRLFQALKSVIASLNGLEANANKKMILQNLAINLSYEED